MVVVARLKYLFRPFQAYRERCAPNLWVNVTHSVVFYRSAVGGLSASPILKREVLHGATLMTDFDPDHSYIRGGCLYVRWVYRLSIHS